MVQATIDVLDSGGLKCDLNWRVLHRDREQHFEDVEFIRFPGHASGLTGTMIHLDGEGTLLVTGDEVSQSENYENEQPLGGPLTWAKRDWFDSLQRVKDLQRTHDAEMVYGHDPEQFELIRTGWSQ